MSQAQNTTFTRLQVQQLRKKAERARRADTLELPESDLLYEDPEVMADQLAWLLQEVGYYKRALERDPNDTAAKNRLESARKQEQEQRRQIGNGWFVSDVDPMTVLCAFPSLRIRYGFRLGAYRYASGAGGNAIVWAIPENSPLPSVEPGCSDPPRPPGALDDFMEAIDGDGSARSFLSASLLAREAAEIGAEWHGRSWSDHQILYEDPEVSKEWKWLVDKPRCWLPAVEIVEVGASVRFYTFTEMGVVRITQWTDRFSHVGCAFKTEQVDICFGPGFRVY